MPASCAASVAQTALRRGNWRARLLRGFNEWSYAQAAAGRRCASEVAGSRRALLNQLQTSRQFGSLIGLRQPAVSVAAYGCILMPKSSLATFREEPKEKELASQDEDPFDPLTDRIPEKPVSVAEGASYGLVILAGLAIAASAVYAVFKELIFEPKEYKIFGKALERVQKDSQVTVRLGTPITGYGQESRNRASRQRISNKVWKDEDGVERVEVVFFIRGPHGAGKVYTEMFRDKVDRTWKFTYLIVDVLSPTPTRLMLESYVPA